MMDDLGPGARRLHTAMMKLYSLRGSAPTIRTICAFNSDVSGSESGGRVLFARRLMTEVH